MVMVEDFFLKFEEPMFLTIVSTFFLVSTVKQSLVQIVHLIFYLFLDELIKVHKLKPVLKWKQAFESYLATMPSYYAAVSTY